jgi:hypothetical protein
MSCYRLAVLFGGVLLFSVVLGAPWPGMSGLALDPDGIRFMDGSFQSTAALPSLPANMTWVVPAGSGSEYDDYYTSPFNAMENLADWCVLGGDIVPVDARCALLIAPGTYWLEGDQQIIMHEKVDIIGMGVDSTVIRGFVKGSNWDGTSAVIRGAADAALRNLAVANLVFLASASGDHSSAIYNDGAGFHVNNVSVSVNGNDRNYGIINNGVDATYTDLDIQAANIWNPTKPSALCFGFWARGAGNVEINHAEVMAEGCSDSTAIQDNGANLRLVRIHANANCPNGPCGANAVWNVSGVLTILNSRLEGVSRSITIGSDSDRIINTHFNGPVIDAFPGIQCRETYGNSLGDVPC